MPFYSALSIRRNRIGFACSCFPHEQLISVTNELYYCKMKIELYIVRKLLFDAPPDTSLQSADASDELTCSIWRHVNTFRNIRPTHRRTAAQINSIRLACVHDENISEAFGVSFPLSHRLIILLLLFSLYLSISIYSDCMYFVCSSINTWLRLTFRQVRIIRSNARTPCVHIFARSHR